MTWFDLVVLLLAGGILFWESRQEAGQGLFDTLATLIAFQAAPAAAAPVTTLFRWQPWPGTDISPLAQGLCFLVLLALALTAARLLHRRTRWSMDNYDLLFGVAFGLVVATMAGHVFADTLARHAILKHDRLPAYLAGSTVAEELRSFRSYHYVVNVCNGFRRFR